MNIEAQNSLGRFRFSHSLVSFVISAFATVHDRSDGKEYMLIFAVIGILGAIWGLSRMHAYGPLEIASYGIKFRLGKRTFKRADVIAWATYLINAALIALAALVYWGGLPQRNCGR